MSAKRKNFNNKKGNKTTYRLINIDAPRTTNEIVFDGYSFTFRKIHFSKKLKIKFEMFCCVRNGCPCCIRRETVTGLYYFACGRRHTSNCQEKTQLDVVPEPKFSNPNDSLNQGNFFPRKKKISGKKRKRGKYGVNSGATSKIHGVLPSEGPLSGENSVDIYFSVSVGDGMNRLLENIYILFISFGENSALRLGTPVKVEDTVRIFDKNFKNHPLLEFCKRAQYVIQAIVPPSDFPRSVNVEILISNMNNPIVIFNGYTYLREDPEGEEKKDMIPQDLYQENNNIFFDDKVYQDNNGYDIDDDNIEVLDDPIWCSPFTYNLIAQNKIKEVRILAAKMGRKIDLDKEDLMGFSALDVARHFGRKEIEKILVDSCGYFYHKITRIQCRCCDDLVELKGTNIFHKCTGSSRQANHNEHIESIKMHHAGGKNHKMGSDWWKSGQCEECKKKFAGNVNIVIGKKTGMIGKN